MTYEIQLLTAVSNAIIPAFVGFRREARRMEQEHHADPDREDKW